mgnify:CR=1 FL=1
MTAIDGPMLPGLPEIERREVDHINVRGYKRARARVRAYARRIDPETSHEAAASVTGLISKQAAVLEVLRKYGPMCDEAIFDALWRENYKMSPSGARTRRSELVDAGKVEWVGGQVTMRSGRRARVWRPRPILRL